MVLRMAFGYFTILVVRYAIEENTETENNTAYGKNTTTMAS
jgi:hypothetical protein